MFKQVKVAALSIKSRSWDKAYNADRLETFFRRAARRNPDLIVAPEGVLEGYVSQEAMKEADKAAALLEIAERIDGPSIARFQRLAKGLRTCLCFGFAERIGRSVYNSAVFIDDRGKTCGKYHKHEEPILVFQGARPTWTSRRMRRRLRAFDTPLGRCGIMICADRWYARLARTLVLDGAQYLLVPAYGSKNKAQNRTILARSRENGVPVVEANVGMNLIINRGEVAAFKWGADRITTAVIDVPQPPSTLAARRYEREYLEIREREEWKWLPEKTRLFPPIGRASARRRSATGRSRRWHF